MTVLKLQLYVLIAGTAFAWYNFLAELFTWRKGKTKCVSGRCSVNPGNPFISPCFGGAVFFTIALILNILI